MTYIHHLSIVQLWCRFAFLSRNVWMQKGLDTDYGQPLTHPVLSEWRSNIMLAQVFPLSWIKTFNHTTLLGYHKEGSLWYSVLTVQASLGSLNIHKDFLWEWFLHVRSWGGGSYFWKKTWNVGGLQRKKCMSIIV